MLLSHNPENSNSKNLKHEYVHNITNNVFLLSTPNYVIHHEILLIIIYVRSIVVGKLKILGRSACKAAVARNQMSYTLP